MLASGPVTPLFWKLLALVFIALGAVGVFLPLVPTVPFLLVAAAAASRGWPWLDRRLTGHPRYGPIIVRWRERGAIPRPAKVYSTLGMLGGAAVLWWVGVPLWLWGTAAATMACVAAWIWARPEQ